MRVTFASLDGLRMCLKIGLQNVAKIARNNDIFGAIDERNYDAVQAPGARIASFAASFRRFAPEAVLPDPSISGANVLARQYYCRFNSILTGAL
jgi:hypothetical protein